MKNVIIPLSQDLWTPSFAVWWLRMREPTQKVTWYINQVVTWLIKDVISPLSQSLWIPNLAGWWLRMKRPHPQSHVKHRSSGHVTNQKYFIFTFTRFRAHKLSRVVTVRMTPRNRSCPRSRSLVSTTQYNCSTSSWSSLLKTDRFQMIMTTLKWFLWWRITY